MVLAILRINRFFLVVNAISLLLNTASVTRGQGEFFRRKMVPSLVDLCVKKWIDNLWILPYVGEIDEYLLELMLPLCSVEQLKYVEGSTKVLQGRDLSPVTDKLWKTFYEKQFGNTDGVIENMRKNKLPFKWKQAYEYKAEENKAQERMREQMRRLVLQEYKHDYCGVGYSRSGLHSTAREEIDSLNSEEEDDDEDDCDDDYYEEEEYYYNGDDDELEKEETDVEEEVEEEQTQIEELVIVGEEEETETEEGDDRDESVVGQEEDGCCDDYDDDSCGYHYDDDSCGYHYDDDSCGDYSCDDGYGDDFGCDDGYGCDYDCHYDD